MGGVVPRHARSRQAERLAALAPSRHLELDVVAQPGDLDRVAEDGLGERDGEVSMEVSAVTVDRLVIVDLDLGQEVATACLARSQVARTTDAECITALDTGRDGDVDVSNGSKYLLFKNLSIIK